MVFLLFNIGLELSLERLRSMQKQVFGMGTSQVGLFKTSPELSLAKSKGLGCPRQGCSPECSSSANHKTLGYVLLCHPYFLGWLSTMHTLNSSSIVTRWVKVSYGRCISQEPSDLMT